MRTTVTLDSDVAERIRQEMRRSGRNFKAVVNALLRLGLNGPGAPRKSPRFEVKSFDLRLMPGIDPDRINQIVDEPQAAEQSTKRRP